MHQTLQSTGVCWALHLIIPGVTTIQLGYGRDLKTVLRNLQNCPIHVKSDHILQSHFRIESSGLRIIHNNLRGKREGWRGSRRK